MNISIVIPYKNCWNLSHQLLYDLYKRDKDNIQEVLLVDDASDDSAVIGGEKWWLDQQFLPIRVIRLNENVGFLRAANKGLRKATGDIKVLINNDVRVQQPFVQQVIQLLTENPIQLIGNYFHAIDTGWNKFADRIFPHLAGYLLATTSDGWDVLGYLDEQYVPFDFEDVDISTRAIKCGYKLTSLNLPGITHLGGQSIKYGPEREKLTRINQEKFRRKWMDKNG